MGGVDLNNEKWLYDLNERLHKNWKDFATYFNIPETEQCRFEAGREIYGIANWLSQHGYNVTEKLKAAALELGREDVISIIPMTRKSENQLSNQTQSGKKASKNRLFATFGAPATGKTNLIKSIEKEYKFLSCKTQNITERWNGIFDEYLKKLFDDNDHSYFFKFQIESFASRAKDALQYSMKKLAFIDETIYDSYVYARATYMLNKMHDGKWLTAEDYQSFQHVFEWLEKHIPKPKAIIYLKCNDAALLLNKLKKKDSVKYRNFTEEYIDRVIKAYEELSNEIQSVWGIQVYTFDIKTEDETAIRQKVVSKLQLDTWQEKFNKTRGRSRVKKFSNNIF